MGRGRDGESRAGDGKNASNTLSQEHQAEFGAPVDSVFFLLVSQSQGQKPRYLISIKTMVINDIFTFVSTSWLHKDLVLSSVLNIIVEREGLRKIVTIFFY